MKALEPQSVTHPLIWERRLRYQRVQIQYDLLYMGAATIPPQYQNNLEFLRKCRLCCYTLGMK